MASIVRQIPARAVILIGLSLVLQPYGHAKASPNTPEPGPSFACTGQLSETERTICSDDVFSAYDRAMAWAYARGWRSLETKGRGQTSWLVQRNNCSGRKDCILTAYRNWIGTLDFAGAPAANFSRQGPTVYRDGGQKNDKLGSSSGSVARSSDWGELFVQPIGRDWFLFRALATQIYDPRDGRGPNVSTGDVTGLVHLSINAGTWISDPYSADSCVVRLTRMPQDRWRLADRGSCSGIGANLSGTYHKIRE